MRRIIVIKTRAVYLYFLKSVEYSTSILHKHIGQLFQKNMSMPHITNAVQIFSRDIKEKISLQVMKGNKGGKKCEHGIWTGQARTERQQEGKGF